jgi:plastocyanin
MRINKRWTALIASAALLSATVACGGDNGGSSTDATSAGTATAEATTSTETTPGEASREIEVLMQDNFFEPAVIELAVGEAVTIEAKNMGVAVHNMHVLSSETEGKDYTSAPLVNPGDSSEFVVQFSQPGTYKFQCDFHLPGMVGEITVQ